MRKRSSRHTQEPITATKVVKPETKIKRFIRYYGLSFFILVIAIVGIFNAYRFGIAHVNYQEAEQLVSAWKASDKLQSEEQYILAKNSVNAAQSLHRTSPDYQDLSGQVNKWGVISGLSAKSDLHLAKANFLQATKRRPLWPVTWANLALVKWHLQETDTEMQSYLKKADELGKQSTEVHLIIVKLGLIMHQTKHPFYGKIRDMLHERIARGLRNPETKPTIVTMLEEAGLKKEACRWLRPKAHTTGQKHLDCI